MGDGERGAKFGSWQASSKNVFRITIPVPRLLFVCILALALASCGDDIDPFSSVIEDDPVPVTDPDKPNMGGTITINHDGIGVNPVVGDTLTAWYTDGATSIDFEWLWFRDNERIPGETGIDYTPAVPGSYHAAIHVTGGTHNPPDAGNPITVNNASSSFIETVWISPGQFQMGTPSGEVNIIKAEEDQRSVEINGFYIGKYPVTQRQYLEVMGANPSQNTETGGNPNRLPVENVNVYQAYAFCNRLSQLEDLEPVYVYRSGSSTFYPGIGAWESVPSGNTSNWNNVILNTDANGYRLPADEEWEYACRAETTTAYNVGPSLTPSDANYGGLVGGTTETGKYPPNAWGLYDMHGNVSEWTQALSANNHPDYPYRILRGGSWSGFASTARSASVDSSPVYTRDNTRGFRVARRVPPEKPSGTAAGTAWGRNGLITVTITKVNGSITDVQIDAREESNLSAVNSVVQNAPGQIKSRNTVNVDMVSGATITRNAIIEAGNKAVFLIGNAKQ